MKIKLDKELKANLLTALQTGFLETNRIEGLARVEQPLFPGDYLTPDIVAKMTKQEIAFLKKLCEVYGDLTVRLEDLEELT